MRLQKVLQRRAVLLQQIARQRAELEALALPYQASAGALDRLYGVARHVGGTGIAIGTGLMSYLLLRKPRMALKLASAALTAAGAWLAFKKKRQDA